MLKSQAFLVEKVIKTGHGMVIAVYCTNKMGWQFCPVILTVESDGNIKVLNDWYIICTYGTLFAGTLAFFKKDNTMSNNFHCVIRELFAFSLFLALSGSWKRRALTLLLTLLSSLHQKGWTQEPPGQLKAPAKQRMLLDKGTSVQPHNSGQALSSSSSSPEVCPLRVDFAQPYNV